MNLDALVNQRPLVRNRETWTRVREALEVRKMPTPPIDAADALPSEASFEGPAGLKRTLLEERHDDLVRRTASKMPAYALGRQLEYYDEPALRGILGALEADGYRFRTLVKAIVASYPFRYKKTVE